MKEISHVITDPLGLHARPAGQLVKTAAGFHCQIWVGADDVFVDAKRVMGVMRMAAKEGTLLTLRCEGADEEEAAKTLQQYLVDNL